MHRDANYTHINGVMIP